MEKTKPRRTAAGALIFSFFSVWSAALPAAYAGAATGLHQASRLAQGLYENSTELPTLSFLERAQKTIDIEIYTMNDPAFRAGLRSAMARGVRVRVIKDATPVSEKCDFFAAPSPKDDGDCLDQKHLASEVSGSGGAFVPFNKAALCGIPGKPCFEHGKMILIDGGIKSNQAVLLSSGNFDVTSFCDLAANPAACDRDYSYISADPGIVRALSLIFEHDFAGQPYDVRGVIAPVAQQITVSPFSEAPLVAFIRSAKKSVVVQNQYLHENAINQALIDVARSGVKVYVQVASFCAFGHPDAYSIKHETDIFQAFDAAGISTRIFSGEMAVGGKPGYLHAKAILVDGTVGWVGSVNGSITATSANREFGIFFTNRSATSHLNAVMHADFMDPAAESWQESLNCAKDPQLAVAD